MAKLLNGKTQHQAIGHFRIVLCLFFKARLGQNLSCENEFYLHVNENSFSYERLCTKTRFEKEVQDNSEMDYLLRRQRVTTLIFCQAEYFKFWWLH